MTNLEASKEAAKGLMDQGRRHPRRRGTIQRLQRQDRRSQPEKEKLKVLINIFGRDTLSSWISASRETLNAAFRSASVVALERSRKDWTVLNFPRTLQTL